MPQPASPSREQGPPFGTKSRPLDSRALAFSLALTALLIGLLALLGPSYRAFSTPDRVLAVFPLPAIEDIDSLPQKVEERDKVAATSEQPASAPAPRAVISAPNLSIVPTPEISLTPFVVPRVIVADRAPTITEGLVSDGDRAIGVLAGAGSGGAGSGGNGPGGTGGGSGTGSGKKSKLTASWAPEMHLAQLNSFYPQAAKASENGGVAWLKCKALRGNRVRYCSLVGEQPRGLGFGRAALAAEKIMRVQVRDRSGRQVYNEWFVLEAAFQKPGTSNKQEN